jgi:GxxExxY protein
MVKTKKYDLNGSNQDLILDPLNDYLNKGMNDLTYKIIGCCMEVPNAMGRGFLEGVYTECLSIEFEEKKIPFVCEERFELRYKGKKLKKVYVADFVIAGNIILEIKAQNLLIGEDMKQTINYLAASKCEIGLLINFGENSLKYKRVLLSKKNP